MKSRAEARSPSRIADLVALKKGGAKVECYTSFGVIPVDFQHREQPYQAHVFLCYFAGAVDDEPFAFRKCYARGCSHNLCPHVSQAVLIANRYLQRDYRLLREAGIEVEERLFSLEDMIVKFDGYREEQDPTLTLEDYMAMAREGTEIKVEMDPEYVPAAEHFSNYTNAQTFLIGNFSVRCLGRTHRLQRCFACYPTGKDREQKGEMMSVANSRLEELYKDFERASITHEKRYFA